MQSNISALFVRAIVITLIIALGHASPAVGDGKFFRRLEVATDPSIRAQRAVVTFRDGVQSLIVQSDYDVADGHDTLGWILPLPANPTEIAPCHPRTLEALDQCIQPRIAEFPTTWLVAALWLAAVTLLISHARLQGAEQRVSWFRIALALLLITPVAAWFLLPSLSIGGYGLAASRVEVLQSARAGIYDITVIRGASADAVESWLDSNGFATAPGVTEVIDGYVTDGWCFLAARIAADHAGARSHHPLRLTFPSPSAVYPMRLTGVNASPLALDFYVIGERSASTSHLSIWSRDVYHPDTNYRGLREFAYQMPTIYRADGYRRNRVGIPEVSDLMWPGCVVTRLHGTLDPTDMADDLTVDWHSSSPRPVTLFNRAGALGLAGAYALAIAVLLIVWGTVRASRKGWPYATMVRKSLIVIIVAGVAVGTLRYLTLEVVRTRIVTSGAIREMRADYAHHSALQAVAEDPPGAHFPQAYQEALANRHNTRRAGAAKPPKDRADLDRAGDYHIEPFGDGWRLTVIDWPYTPIMIAIDSNGVPQPAAP
jgi:hypothetical protein